MLNYEALRERPFFLKEEQIQWVRDTLAAMTTEEKLGQVFCAEIRAGDEAAFRKITQEYKLGAVMCLPASLEEMHGLIGRLQKESAVPMLIAGNLEEGADAIRGGTNIANNLEIGATGSSAFARQMGAITAAEATAVGMNWAFAPVIDIGMNWRNPVIATRVFGSDPAFVAEAGAAFTQGLQAGGMAAAIKHFPGDGVDERDQHFSPTVNSLSCEEWDSTYGEAYRRSIEAGALTVMVGHIMQPAWSMRLNPSLRKADVLPGSTSPELLQGLLRKRLGFNGMISTDSTTMTGFDQLLPRSRAIPAAIAAGCDMILFTKDMDEDVAALRNGLEQGVVTAGRLNEAVMRVLAVKAALGLADCQRQFQLPLEEARSRFGKAEYRAVERSCADLSVTLVKAQEGLLPLSPERRKRVYLVTYAEGRGFGSSAEAVAGALKEKLEQRGFQVTCHCDAGEDAPIRGGHRAMAEQYDLILYATNLNSISNKAVCRLDWSNSMGKDAPDFLEEIPTIFISFGNPYHLVDVPRVKTYINAYKFKESVIDAVLDKLLGKSPFLGKTPVDPYCGFWDTAL
ncbi:MAG: glycoside hydrolase family 3 protein [Clostridiales bacterium]|nr:glycoside hydrolase family 3 protein [Clostridiales bacterium]